MGRTTVLSRTAAAALSALRQVTHVCICMAACMHVCMHACTCMYMHVHVSTAGDPPLLPLLARRRHPRRERRHRRRRGRGGAARRAASRAVPGANAASAFQMDPSDAHACMRLRCLNPLCFCCSHRRICCCCPSADEVAPEAELRGRNPAPRECVWSSSHTVQE